MKAKVVLKGVYVFCMMVFNAAAQNNSIFNGGVADGAAIACYLQASPPLIGNNIFKGGNADGVAVGSYIQSPAALVGSDVFKGGNADGVAVGSYIQSPAALIGSNIFRGGVGDGHGISGYQQAFSALIGNDIFKGGIADGFTFVSVGSFGFEVALPVDLLSFDAVPVNNFKVRCQWSTLSEFNNDFFTLERSSDNLLFDEVGVVDGAGTSNEINSYTFYDDTPLYGLSYYRLKQTDFDGAFSYSIPVPVKLVKENNSSFKVFPNPIVQTSNIVFDAGLDVSNAVIEICDVQGKRVYSKGLNSLLCVGDNVYVFNKEQLKPGVYFLLLKKTSMAESTIKLIIQ